MRGFHRKITHVSDDLLFDDDKPTIFSRKDIARNSRFPVRAGIVKDAVTKALVRKYLEAHEKGEKLTQFEAGKEFNMHPSRVSTTLKQVRATWRETAIRDWDKLVDHELAVLNALEEEAWQSWKESLEDETILTIETDEHGDEKEKVRIKGQTGDPRYFDIILKCIAARTKLLGLNAPEEIEIRTQETKVLEHLKSGRIDIEQLKETVGPVMADIFLKKSGINE